MTRDELIDCLRGKEGKPISIRHAGGILMGIFEEIVWNTDAFTIRGVKMATCKELFEPEDIVEINDSPGYTLALEVTRKLTRLLNERNE